MTVIRTAAGALLLCAFAACATTATQTATPDGRQPAAAATELPPQPPQPMAVPVPNPVPAPTPVIEAPTAPVPASPPVAGKPKPAKPVAKPEKQAAAPAPAAAAKSVEPNRATGASVGGKLELVAAGREGIVAGELADGLVYFLPKSGGARPKAGSFNVDTRSKGFSPSVLVVPVGSTVRFPNRDSILHNVFSRTPGSTFDSGFYGPGQVKQQVFSKPGLVIVNCNVHHNMRADIVVLATSHYTRPDRNGRYSLSGLPAGPGTLVFWHPRAQAQSVAVTLPMQGAVTRKLSATKPSRFDITARR